MPIIRVLPYPRPALPIMIIAASTITGHGPHGERACKASCLWCIVGLAQGRTETVLHKACRCRVHRTTPDHCHRRHADLITGLCPIKLDREDPPDQTDIRAAKALRRALVSPVSILPCL